MKTSKPAATLRLRNHGSSKASRASLLLIPALAQTKLFVTLQTVRCPPFHDIKVSLAKFRKHHCFSRVLNPMPNPTCLFVLPPHQQPSFYELLIPDLLKIGSSERLTFQSLVFFSRYSSVSIRLGQMSTRRKGEFTYQNNRLVFSFPLTLMEFTLNLLFSMISNEIDFIGYEIRCAIINLSV